MTAHVKAALDVLCAYYSDRDGQPRRLNPVQVTVYASGLARFSADELQRAARIWMARSKFFPALSDLLEILAPAPDLHAAAHLAWASVEDAIRRGGIYRGAYFAQGAIGEAARQTFGTWARACSFDADSPGWAIRRQTFLAIFPALCQREIGPVLLPGLPMDRPPDPYVVPEVAGLPTALPAHADDGPALSRTEAAALLGEIRQRALAVKR